MRKKQKFKWDRLSLGTCYYPEHWEKKLWKEDLERMLASGIETIRIGEFAWSKIEPGENQFNFTFFDEFLEVTRKVGMKVIFGTPTATPPVWLTEKYPEVLNSQMDGVLMRHGMRRHYNYNSLKYRELCRIIVEKIGEHYGKHPSIIGWQVDNEFNGGTDRFYSESDTLAFREFLKKKYKTLDGLNDAWGTVFWNQTYTEWEEIYVPRTTVYNTTNPHQELDYFRFISDSVVSFCKMQADILRKYCKPGDFITTNGMFRNIDNHALTDESLDVYTFDSYPNMAFCLSADPKNARNLNDRRWSDKLTEVRSICPHFGIMEQQSGTGGWNTKMEGPAPKPGQMMLWTMQSIGHGADYISYFRWRTCTVGTEIYWHGILDYDNRDNRRLAEVQRIWQRIKAVNEVAGAEYKAGFAMLRDYSNIWDAQLDVWHKRLAWESEEEIFIAAQISHTPMDYLYLLEDTQTEELMKYPVLIYPHGLLLSEKKTSLLKEYVAQGGCLVIGARTGQKDENGRCMMTPMPGLLAEISGSDVKDYTFVGSMDDKVYMNWNGRNVEAGLFNDIMETAGDQARVLAEYASNYYKGRASLIENTYGKGRVLHFGGTFTRENVKELLAYTGVLTPYRSIVELPEECELCVREKEGNRYLFVLNFDAEPKEFLLKKEMKDMDSDLSVQGRMTLAGYETKVYKMKDVR